MAEQHGKALVPQIRFAGFTDPWEQRKLGELASKRIEKNTNGIKETFTNSAEHGVVSQLDYFDHDITNDANIGNYSVVHPDDFIYNPRISAVAPCGPINRNKLDRNGVMSPLYTVFSVDDTIDKLYLEHYFKTSRWHQFMFLEGNSGARSDRFSISDSIFFEMPIQCPVLEEQELIASFFGRLDSLITLHQRKYDKLCVLKKSMLDKMFPKGGSLYPEIRFAGFTDPWEQRKLGEVAPLQRGFDLPVSQMISGPYPVVMSNGVGGWHSKYAVKGPGVVTGRSGTIGGLQYIEGDFWPHNTSLWVTSFNGNEPKFIYWLYSSMNLERFGSGSGVPTLNRNDVHDQLIGVPCNIAEQRQIGAFFDCLDSLITLHQRKYCGVASWMLGVALVRLGSESDGAFGEMKHVLR